MSFYDVAVVIVDLSPADPRIVVASPCSGHGYKFASVIGEALADLATERTTGHDLSRFTIGRFANQAVCIGSGEGLRLVLSPRAIAFGKWP